MAPASAPVPRAIAPKQERSRATRDRICTAMRELLEEKPYHAIRMDELAERAGCSSSSLYSRFSSKLAVLHFLHEEALDDAAQALEPLDTAGRAPDWTVPELAASIARDYVAYRRRHWAVLRTARELEADDPATRSRRALHDKRGFEKIRNAMVACARREGSGISDAQMDQVILMVAGAIRAIVDDPGHGALSTEGWSDTEQRETQVAQFVHSALAGLLASVDGETDPPA